MLNTGRTFIYLQNIYVKPWQIPEIAETKIQGLKKFYGVNSQEGLEFFEAHKSADVVHRAECEKLLDSLSKEDVVVVVFYCIIFINLGRMWSY